MNQITTLRPVILLLALGILTACGSGAAAPFFSNFFSGRDGEKAEPPPDPALQAWAESAWLASRGQKQAAVEALERCVEAAPDSFFLRARLVDAYLEADKPGEAKRALEPLQKSDPENPEVMRLSARVALKRGELDSAIAWYERSRAIQPENREALAALVVLYYEHKKDLEKTKEVCARLLETGGQNNQALLYHAEASALTGDIEYAAELYRRLIRNYPQLISRLDDLAQRLAQRGRREQALRLYRYGVLMAPDSALIQRGFESLAGDGGTTATLAAYASLAEEAPLNADIQRLYATRLREAGRYEEAEARLERVLELQPNDMASLIALAEISLARSRMEEALERYNRAIERHPNDPEVYNSAARLYLLRDDVEVAERLLERALTLGPQNATTLVLLADAAERRGDPAQTEARLKQALDALPGNPTILSLLTTFYERQGRPGAAAEMMEQLLAARPRDTAVFVRLFGFYLAQGRDSAAESLIERGRRAFEDSIDFDLVAAQAALNFNAPALAEELLLRALQTNPHHLDARRLLALAYLRMGDGDAALAALQPLEKTVSGAENRLAWDLAMADVYTERREWEAAARHYRSALQADPEAIEIHATLVETLFRAGKKEAAAAAANEAVRRFQTGRPLETQLLRARLLVLQKEFARAESLLRSLAAEHAGDTRVFFAQGLLYSDLKNLEAAETAYRGVIASDPMNATAYNNLGYLMADLGVRLEEARDLILKAHELQPGAGFILDSLGWVSFRLGDLDKAVEYLEEARRRIVADPDVYAHLGAVYEARGDTQAAARYYAEALRLDPDNAAVKAKAEALKNAAPPAASRRSAPGAPQNAPRSRAPRTR